MDCKRILIVCGVVSVICVDMVFKFGYYFDVLGMEEGFDIMVEELVGKIYILLIFYYLEDVLRMWV